MNWISYLEYNFSHYELERSTDGQNFEFVTKIESRGGDFFQNYVYDDHQVLKGQLYYYRLKMYDLDDSYSYSEIRTVQLEMVNEINIYPNPVTTVLNVNFGNIKVSRVVIRNNLGQEILHISPYPFIEKIDLGTLEDGFYFITFIDENGRYHTKEFIKNRS